MSPASGRWLLAVMVLALAFRLAAVSVPRMNVDEAWNYYLCRNPLPEVLDYLVRDRHPPLWVILEHTWLRLGSHQEFRLRAPVALLAWLTVGLVFLTGRELAGDDRAGIGAAALYAVAYPAWEHDTWLKSQALLSPAAGLATWLFLRILRTGGRREAAGYTLACALLLYSHYLGFLVLAAHGAAAFGVGRRRLRRLVACWAICALLYAPWAPRLAGQIQVRAGRDLQAGPAPRLALETAGRLLPMLAGLDLLPGLLRDGEGRPGLPSFPTLALGAALVAAGLAVGLRRLRGRPARLLAVLAGLPLAVLLAGIAFKFPELSRPRYYVLFLPYLGVALAAGLGEPGRGRLWPALILAAALAVNGAVLLDYLRHPYFRTGGWQEAAAWVARRQDRAQLIAAHDNYCLHPFNYYYAGQSLDYLIAAPGISSFRYRPDYRGLPLLRLWPQQVATGEIEELLEGVERAVLILWYDRGTPQVREWFARRYGVVDQLVVPSHHFDAAFEVYLIERFPGATADRSTSAPRSGGRAAPAPPGHHSAPRTSAGWPPLPPPPG